MLSYLKNMSQRRVLPLVCFLAVLLAVSFFAVFMVAWDQKLVRRFDGATSTMTVIAPPSQVALVNVTTAPRSPLPPGYFSSSFNTTLRRGFHVITSVSGCHLTAWVYQSGRSPRYVDCKAVEPDRILYANRTTANSNIQQPNLLDHMQPYDTVYINIMGLSDFVQDIVPHLKVPIVLISGNLQKCFKQVNANVVQTVLDHPLIVYWFCHSIDHYLPMTHHPKLHPWPYGMNQGKVNIFKKVFWKYYHVPKTEGILIGHITVSTNVEKRQNVPSGPYMDVHTFFTQLAKHRFVLSPDGDRPECYRHYEAIGLGTIPLTQMDPVVYHHLNAAPVVYNMTNYRNVTEHSEALQPYGTHFPGTNPLLITEEYWLDYVDNITGMSSRWWDIVQNKQVPLKDFVQDNVASDMNL